jgi:hypothetical protein
MNVLKYRRLILVTFLVVVMAAFLSLAAIWNSLLNVSDVRNEGWIIVFIFIHLIASGILFYFSFKLSDKKVLQNYINSIVETEKEKITKKFQEKEKHIFEETLKEADISEKMKQLMAGLQSAKSVDAFANKLLINLSKQIEIVRGVFFMREKGKSLFNCKGEYALTGNTPPAFKIGEGLTGQVAKSQRISTIEEIPENYFKAESGLGSSLPKHLIIFPVIYNEETMAVIELATFKKINPTQLKILNTLTTELGERLNKFVTA